MTKIARAQTFPAYATRVAQQNDCPVVSEWINFGDAEDSTYPKWYLAGNALRVQISKSDLGPGQSTCDQTFLTQNNPYFSTDDQGETFRTSPVPDYVFCSIVVSIRRCANQTSISPKSKFLYPDSLQMRWQDAAEHDQLRRITDHFVRQQGPPEKREYLSTSRVRLLEQTPKGFKEVDSCTFETSAQWNRVLPQMVARFCSSGQWTPFFLELNAEYEWFVVAGDSQLRDDTTYFSGIQNTLGETALENFDDKSYWSKRLLKRLFDRSTIRKLVAEYVERKRRSVIDAQQPEYVSDEDRDKFESWLWRDRIRLLAVTIHINADLDCLYNLMTEHENGAAGDVKDSQIPLSSSVYKSFLKSHHHTPFRRAQAGFTPVDFPEPMKALCVGDSDLVPIYFDKQGLLGDGGTSEVFKATIHSDYHAFSPNRNEVFALKILKDYAVKDAQNEVQVWQRFAKVPHPHINSFHTCWTQKGTFYMLSPLAEFNLAKLLNDYEVKDFSRGTEQILEQLEGIASAIQHIHYFGRAGYSRSKIDNDKVDYGYHHDLKPANILVFDTRYWKITDFGTAKIRRFQSGSPQTSKFYSHTLPAGDQEYGGPDRDTNKTGLPRTGSAYDIWSFGCILLEVLLWTFGKTGKDLKEFWQERVDDKLDTCKCRKKRSRKSAGSNSNLDNGTNDSLPTFWYQCSKAKEYHVKPSVQIKLEWIKEQMKATCPVLEPLHDLIQKMLSVSAKDRPAASVVLSELGILRVWAGTFFAKQRNKSGVNETSAYENPDFDTETGYESYARSSRMSSPSPTDEGTTEGTPSGQPSQRSSQKRRRTSSAHSNKDLNPINSEADILHTGSSALLNAPVDRRPSLKKQRGNPHADADVRPHDKDPDSYVLVPSSAPELDDDVTQKKLLPLDWEQAVRPSRLNQPRPASTRDTTWIEKQMASSAES